MALRLEPLTRTSAPGASARRAVPATARAFGAPTVERLARWLLVAVGVDLVLTRGLVRMSIFVPKGEPWSTLAAAMGRAGAAVDTLVPIVGALLVVALLARAGRRTGVLERLLPIGLALIATGGAALVFFPSTPLVVASLDAIVVGVAAGSAALTARHPQVPGLARAGLIALAASIALAAGGRALAAVAQAGSSGAGMPEGFIPALSAAGQFGFVLGAAFLGLAGFRATLGATSGRWPLVAGVVIALLVVVAAGRSPVMWGALEIWSIGLTGVVPAGVLAVALGLAAVGLPGLFRQLPGAATGGAIVVLSGFGLAASGLLLAALLGLVVAASEPARAVVAGMVSEGESAPPR